MKLIKITSLILFSSIIAMYGCDPTVTSNDSETFTETALNSVPGANPWTGTKATGEFQAMWQGCEDGHEEPPNHEEGGCEGHDGEESHSDDGLTNDIHDEVTHSGNRPARDFYVQFDAQLKRDAKGNVTFLGTNDYEGVDFSGPVTWVEHGRNSNELFFGGKITDGTVSRGCFLFSVQDNGEGKKAEADRLQYRLYGSSNTACQIPDHFPRGYPIAVYNGNLKVH